MFGCNSACFIHSFKLTQPYFCSRKNGTGFDAKVTKNQAETKATIQEILFFLVFTFRQKTRIVFLQVNLKIYFLLHRFSFNGKGKNFGFTYCYVKHKNIERRMSEHPPNFFCFRFLTAIIGT
jgi:hypothetical protein